MKLNQIDKGNVTVIELQGKLMGGPDAVELRETLHGLVERDVKNFVLDLKGVDWINSSGLGILISGLTTVRNSGGDLCLAQPGDKIKNILTITKLSSVFNSFDELDDAVASFK